VSGKIVERTEYGKINERTEFGKVTERTEYGKITEEHSMEVKNRVGETENRQILKDH